MTRSHEVSISDTSSLDLSDDLPPPSPIPLSPIDLPSSLDVPPSPVDHRKQRFPSTNLTEDFVKISEFSFFLFRIIIIIVFQLGRQNQFNLILSVLHSIMRFILKNSFDGSEVSFLLLSFSFLPLFRSSSIHANSSHSISLSSSPFNLNRNSNVNNLRNARRG